MHYLRQKKKGKKGYMGIKIDLAKAYDKVEWHVLLNILHKLGFDRHFLDLIGNCITAPHFSILLNGSPFGFFTAGRGIRQSDPMSPAIFTIYSDLLSQLLARAEQTGKISGIKVSRHSLKVTHLMYADDLVIYCQATNEEAMEVTNCLETYSSWTG